MKLFLDTANLDDIKKYAAWGLVDGVTTNPTLVAKEGPAASHGASVSFEKRVKDICKTVKGPVSAEVTATNVEGMVKEGRAYAQWAKNIYVKCPCTPEGLQATQKLSKKGIRVNVTLVFSANQALLAAKSGAAFVSPFIGRLDDAGHHGMEVVHEILEIYRHYGYETEVLVASVRSPRQVTEAAMLGADICTMPAKIFDQLIRHPLTDAGVKKFLDDWKKVKN